MLEGGGKTPILTPIELEELGYKIVAYPLSLMGVSICAMQVRFCTSYYLFLQQFCLFIQVLQLGASWSIHIETIHLRYRSNQPRISFSTLKASMTVAP